MIEEAIPGAGAAIPVAPDTARLISVDTEPQRSRMRQFQSFQFRHRLGHSPLLNLPAIRQITGRLLEQRKFDQILFDAGLEGWGPKRADATNGAALLEALDHYGSRRAWLRLTRVDEIAPEFKELVNEFYRDLSGLHGRDIGREVFKTFVTLFVSSPRAVTPYHIDHTWNYLLQISGEKTVHLYDPKDARVLTQAEREDWYGAEVFVTQKQDVTGIPYHLRPGDGVHHPVNAPHWVQNGEEISISLSLGLCLHESNNDAHVYQANHFLRSLGLRPRPPRTSSWSDSLKRGCIRAISKRSQNSFDDVLFSGSRRLRRMMKITGLSRLTSSRRIEIT